MIPFYVMSIPRALKILPRVWGLVRIWLVLRILTSIWAALVSTLCPLTMIEQTVASWPPSAPWGQWLHRALLAPWQRWDASWYLRILTEGYQFGNGTDTYHPLFPWLAWPITCLGLDPLFALMLIGNLATLAFLLLFERMAALDSTPAQAQTASDLLLFFPMTFILFAPYNEGLFLFLSGLTFLWARQHRWRRAGIAGALAVLTRQQGLFLVLPFAWEVWGAHGGDVRRVLRNWRCWSALGLLPIGLGLWLLYRVLVIGGNQLNFSSPYAMIYSMFISPSAWQAKDSHFVTWPWHALLLALIHLWTKPDLDLAVNLALSTAFLGAVLLAWPHLRSSYRVYVLAMVLISFSYQTGAVHPYMGLPRHLFLAFPVFIGLGQIARCSRNHLFMIGSLGLAGICFLISLYVLRAWVP